MKTAFRPFTFCLLTFAVICLSLSGCTSDPAAEKEKREKAVILFLENLVKEEIGQDIVFTIQSREFEERPEAVNAAITYSFRNKLGLEGKGMAHMTLCPMIVFAESVLPDITEFQREEYGESQESPPGEFPYAKAAVSSLVIDQHTFSVEELEVLNGVLSTPKNFPSSTFEKPQNFTFNYFRLAREEGKTIRLITERADMLERWVESRKTKLGEFSYSILLNQNISSTYKGVTKIVLTEVNTQMTKMESKALLDALCPTEGHAFWGDGLKYGFIYIYAGNKELGDCSWVRFSEH